MGQPQRGRRCAVTDQLLPGAEPDGKEQQAVLVDEVVVDQRLRQLAAAVDLQLAPGLLLQPGHLGGHVAVEQRGVVPVHGRERVLVLRAGRGVTPSACRRRKIAGLEGPAGAR
jgi:hypothetical protein